MIFSENLQSTFLDKILTTVFVITLSIIVIGGIIRMFSLSPQEFQNAEANVQSFGDKLGFKEFKTYCEPNYIAWFKGECYITTLPSNTKFRTGCDTHEINGSCYLIAH